MRDSSDAVSGTVAGRYRIEREVGRGGMAVVFLAQDLEQDRPVALKLLRSELVSAVSSQRFLREIRLLARLQHPHILPLYDTGTLGDRPFYVMPFISGETLHDRLSREKQLPVEEAIAIACDVLDAMQHAHEQDIVHRDIKPANILLTSDHAYVADFGIARAIHCAAEDVATSTGLAVGTPAYMSPEQATAERELDGRSDVYSLGCVLFEMLAGLPPFIGATSQAVVSRRFVAPAPSVRELRDAVPRYVEEVVAKALARAPPDRFATAAAMRAALAQPSTAARGQPTTAARGQTIRVGVSRRWAVMLGGGGGVVALALLMRLGWGFGSESVDRLVESGQAHISAWAPEEAVPDLQRAVAMAPRDARAQLWLAQAGAMVSGDADRWWRIAARRSADRRDGLLEHEQHRALALAALADGRYPEACEGFRRLIDVVGQDPGAELGLGDCQAEDPVVVADSTSSSGWRFRSSYHGAVGQYMGVLERHADSEGAMRILYGRLARLLRADPSTALRVGRTEGGVDEQFAAHQGLIGDTLAFLPYPTAELDVGGRGMVAQGTLEASSRNRQMLRTVAIAWSELSPGSADALEALARTLEATGELYARGAGTSALDAVVRARAASVSREQQLRLAHTHVRLLLKTFDFAGARALADSTLAAWSGRSSGDVGLLAALAALTGRADRTAELLRGTAGKFRLTLHDGRDFRPHAEIGGTALALLGYASLGRPLDSLRTLHARFEMQLDSYVSPADRSIVRDALVSRALSLAAPALGTRPLQALETDVFLVRLQRALAYGNGEKVRSELADLEQLRRQRPASIVSVDATYLEAWLYAQSGDTTAAIRHLDRLLNALPALGTTFLNDAPRAGALVRSMALRARLGAERQDPSAAVWAEAVQTLWSVER